MNLQARLAHRVLNLSPSPIRKLAPLMRLPGMVFLGGGYPNPQTFGFADVNLTFKNGSTYNLTAAELSSACQYGPTDGQQELIPLLQQWQQAKDGVVLDNQQLVVLNGSQEGLHIMAYLFLDQDDCVAISEPAYPGALGAFKAFCNNFISTPIDANGTVTAELERLLVLRQTHAQSLPKFIYEVPCGHNPGGVTLSLERRKHLLAIASRFDLLILEDDPYQLLRLETQKLLPTLQALDTEHRVLRLDSFSKIFAPGLRLGFASGPQEVISAFKLYKQGSNLHTSSMVQALLTAFFANHSFAEFRKVIRTNCELYRTNRDAMVAAAQDYLPSDVHFNIPCDGMFIWFQLPAGFNAERMVSLDGTELGVLLVPGSAFSTSGGLGNYMRASFSMVSPENIRLGMQRFAVMVERERARQ